jgi:hypothetical protein
MKTMTEPLLRHDPKAAKAQEQTGLKNTTIPQRVFALKSDIRTGKQIKMRKATPRSKYFA